MLEYVDRNSLSFLLGRYPDIPAEAAAALLFEAESDDLEAWESRLTSAGALLDASWFATGPKDRERFRAFRHSLPELVIEAVVRRGFLKMGTDYAVPLERNRDMLAFYRKRLEETLPGRYVIYGHIGDAHVHVNMLPCNAEEADMASALLNEFARHAVLSWWHGLSRAWTGKKESQAVASPVHRRANSGHERCETPARSLLALGTRNNLRGVLTSADTIARRSHPSSASKQES